MDGTVGSMRRKDVLERCPGMNEERAERLLELLPELGRVSTPYALRLAGLSAAHGADRNDVTKRKVLPIKRLLAECMKEVLQDKEGRFSTFLRHLALKHREQRTRVCLAATLRYYSTTLRHPAHAAAGVYPEGDDAVLLAAEDDSIL